MADFSKLNFFNRLDARARVLVLFLAVLGLIILVYAATKLLGGGEKAVGPSRLASTPPGLQSIPGGKKTTAEYQRALNVANAQAAEAAKMTGGSAIPTQVYTSNFGPGSCVICSDKNANVKTLLDQWLREGKLTQDTAALLNDLASKNVSVDEYAAALDQLVKNGKLTPSQARELLEEYKKQHANALLGESEKMMDDIIKSGNLPLDVANQLLDAQRRGVSTAEYANMLQNLVRQGKISPAVAQQLLKQYIQQRIKEALKKQDALIDKMAQEGAITPDVAKQLKELTDQNVSVDAYAKALNDLVAQGKLTPAVAAKLLASYRALKLENGTLAAVTGQNISEALQKQDALIDEMVQEGAITPDVAQQLKDLTDQNLSVDAYAKALNDLVAQGKLTPAAAARLLASYRALKLENAALGAVTGQNISEALQKQDALIDAMVQEGAITPDVAKQLKELTDKNVSVDAYAKALNDLVAQGKLTPAAAARLLASYRALKLQGISEALQKQDALIDEMVQEGAITPDVARQLKELTDQNVSVDAYAKALNDLVAQGKLTPAAAARLLASYKALKSGGNGSLADSLQKAESEAYKEISDLLSAGKISTDTAATLTSMVQNNVSMDDFRAAIHNMVQNKKITPDIAQLKINDYTKVKQLRDAIRELTDLQANNASPEEYAAALKRLVAAGVITADQAAQLMSDYQSLSAQPAVAIAPGAFAALQQKVAASQVTAIPEGQFAAAQAQAAVETEQERQARLQAIMNAMNGQAGQLISAWQPQVMAHHEGTAETKKKAGEAIGGSEASGGSSASGKAGATVSSAPIIKGGTIYFAVLDTAINSDYPDTPVLATIVEGKFKGAKLLGKIVTTKGVTGQMDRVSLNFTLMNEDDWLKSKTITAYGIDPDTARTAIASSVDYHYMMRFGAMMATSFLQGYSSAITNAGTATTGIFGTSTTHPQLSAGNKFLVGLGQMGQTLGNATQNYINRPPTVRVDSGVSLGILFMADVS